MKEWVRLLCCLCAALPVGLPAHATSVDFTRIADYDTPIPGGAGTFSDLDPPVIDDGVVAFSAQRRGGIYTSAEGVLEVVADRNTLVPGRAVSFSGGFHRPAVDDGYVAFLAVPQRPLGVEEQGVYANAGGSLTTVADGAVSVPGSTEAFDRFTSVDLDGTEVLFSGGNLTHAGIYRSDGDSLDIVADLDTPHPRGSGNLRLLGSGFQDNGHAAFAAYSEEPRRGVYTDAGGSLAVIAEAGDPLPTGNGTFDFVNELSFDGRHVSFIGESEGDVYAGVYSDRNGALEVIADTDTILPGDTEPFGFFERTSIDNGIVAFKGSNRNVFYGTFVDIGGQLLKVVQEGDVVDGKEVYEVEMTTRALSGNQLALLLRFTDFSSGIYVATIPEPATATLVALGLAGLALRR